MFSHTVSANLRAVLEETCEKVRKPRSTMLFQRGEKSFGMFVVLSGKVSLDVGTDSPFAHCYGTGALLGLPATISRREYSMTAIVTDDAELGFWSTDALDSLLVERPDLCRELLAIMAERLAENHELMKALISRGKQVPQESGVV